MNSLPLAVLLLVATITTAHAGPVMDAVKAAHALSCGIVAVANDESEDDTHGNLSAFGSEICRAVAAGVLGAQARTNLHAYPSEAYAYKALQAGHIDLIVGATPDAALARRYGVTYLNPVFFDGQGFLVHKDRGIANFADLAGKHVCFIGGANADTAMTASAAARHIDVSRFPFEEIGEMEAALVGGRCDAETHDVSALAMGRAGFHGRIHDFDILPDRITLDPLSPVVRSSDPDWARAIDWITGALVQAEIDGVTRANAARLPPAQAGKTGQQWGLFLPDDWTRQVIAAVGNYGEIYERSIGSATRLRLERGPNRPWTQGGMLWGPPIR